MPITSVSEEISREVMALLGTERQVEPFSRRFPGFDLASAYDVVAQVARRRSQRGEIPIGRKIGFTNRALWGGLGVSAPIWNYVYDRTVLYASDGVAAVSIAGMPEARIEPELVLHLAKVPTTKMGVEELMSCIDWVAPGFEIVFSIFPGWSFAAEDAAAAYGVHGALVIGDKFPLSGPRDASIDELSAFTVTLRNSAGTQREGHASNVLGSPIHALKYLVDEIARYPVCEPLKPDEIVTTGTLTEAMPLDVGQSWNARFQGLALGTLHLDILDR